MTDTATTLNDEAREALHAIPPDLPREEWVRAGMAAQAAGLDFDVFDSWSAGGGTYDERAARATWRSFKPGKGIGPGTLFAMARQHGWQSPVNGNAAAPARSQERPKARADGVTAARLFDRFTPAPADHPYILEKQGKPDGLRVVPAGDPLRLSGESMVGALVVPVLDAGKVVTLQFIAPPETAERLKSQGKPRKLNLAGHSLGSGWFMVGELAPGALVYVCEGIGQAWAAWRATGRPAVVSFGWGRVRTVAKALRAQDPGAQLVLVPDVGKEDDAERIAAEIGAQWVRMPAGWPENADINDLALRDGFDALESLLATAVGIAAPEYLEPGIPIEWAGKMAEDDQALREIVRGVLTAGGMSVMYGESNSGKSYLAAHLGFSMTRGVPWLGRQLERGAVLYVAGEGAASIRRRIRAYERHHDCRVGAFGLIPKGLSLLDGSADLEALLEAIEQARAEIGEPVQLIIVDTLARAMAGANENASEDMGRLVRAGDRIREETGAHVMWIHHSGKDQAKGARGHSSLRAALDTELEVTADEAQKLHTATVTKQRDLDSNGVRLCGKFIGVDLGTSQWGDPITACAVEDAEAPAAKVKAASLGKVQQAIMGVLAGAGADLLIRDVASKLKPQDISKTSVYNAVDRLGALGLVEVSAGRVHLINL